MTRSQFTHVVVCIALIALGLVGASGAPWAQDGLSAKLDASGTIHVSRGTAELATIELSAHGPNWQHAPQETATAEIEDLADGGGKRVAGSLPVPASNGGAIEFTETLTTLEQGLRLEYDLTMAAPMSLNGLQFSLYLPVEQYGGNEAMVSRLGGETQIVGLPLERPLQKFLLWRGEGSKVEVAKDTDDAVTLELRAPADVVVQDLRQWDQEVFEIRFPAIMEQEGREVAAGDKFHLDLTVTFAGPVELEGP